MNSNSFEQLVQECLDARQDPLDHAGVLAYVETHPEAIDGLVDLRAVGLHASWQHDIVHVVGRSACRKVSFRANHSQYFQFYNRSASS